MMQNTSMAETRLLNQGDERHIMDRRVSRLNEEMLSFVVEKIEAFFGVNF